jgi:Uma2 family endonuclease
LIVEVLSPSTAYLDRSKKFLLYEKFGVLEYWLIDPIARFIEVYLLAGQRYQRQGIYNIEETFSSPVLNQQIVEVQRCFE